jgi:hypothetical protein
MFLVVYETEKQEFSLKNQILADSRIWLALAWNFLLFQIFWVDQLSKLTEKLKNSALNMFLVVNELESKNFP